MAIASAALRALRTLPSRSQRLTATRPPSAAGAKRSSRPWADPEHCAAVVEAKEKFRRAFGMLTPREQEVAVLLYVKNLTLREVGEVLDVSESRASQIHTRLKSRIRERLDDESSLFREVA